MKLPLQVTLLLLPIAAATPALSQPVTDPAFAATTLSLSASGEARVTPDMATITLGVDTTASSAGRAMSGNAERMAQVIGALKAAGMEPRDLQTSNLSLSPQTVYEDGHPPRVTGYQASNQVTITVRDLGRLGAVVDAVVAAGATNIGQISFGLSNPLAAENNARVAAVKALEEKASLYAGATGYHVARLVNLSEGAPTESAPRPQMALMAMAPRVASTPVEAGTLDVHIDVNGVFELAH
jgi:uncharacterized protein YggE